MLLMQVNTPCNGMIVIAHKLHYFTPFPSVGISYLPRLLHHTANASPASKQNSHQYFNTPHVNATGAIDRAIGAINTMVIQEIMCLVIRIITSIGTAMQSGSDYELLAHRAIATTLHMHYLLR